MSAIAPLPSVQVQVGCCTSSEGLRVRVTTSPSLALPVPDVAITAEVDVGAVVSST